MYSCICDKVLLLILFQLFCFIPAFCFCFPRALELQPFSLKPLLRRAMAHESMERYRQAYIDYKTVLQIDSSIQAANDSANR